jgi:hypothetical protein
LGALRFALVTIQALRTESRHETVFYDPEAFVQPVRDVRFFPRLGDYDQYPPFSHEHCHQSIFVGPDGRPTQVSPGTTVEHTVRDLYERPWAQIWEEYFERDMQGPAPEPAETEDALGGFR